MKTQFIGLLIATGLSTFASAQNVWEGTQIPTTSLYGKVGIGTNSPAARLHVGVGNSGSSFTKGMIINNYAGLGSTNGYLLSITEEQAISPPQPATLLFAVDRYQTIIPNKLRIGSLAANGAYANYKLSVDGDMIAKRCVIQVNSWADFVFQKNYTLPSLQEVERYISKNQHLPGIPGEQEVLEKGVEVGEMNALLLQKVEELTLYVIQLQKEIDGLKSKN